MIQLRLSLLTVLTIASTTCIQAQTQQRLNLEQATVFLSGAELVSTASISVAKGENEVIFSNVAGDVNSQSLTVNATNGVVVQSATFQNNYLNTENISPKAKSLKDSIELATDKRTQIYNKISSLNEQVSILQANRIVRGEHTGLSVAELTKMLELVNTKMEGYLNQKNQQEKLLKQTDERIANLNRQLQEEQQKGYQPGGQLVVKFYAKEATNAAITVDYVVPNAGWSPTYDIHAVDAHSPVKLFYKANIYQNTGVKWNNVRLTLSSGNPNEGMQPPVLNPVYLSFFVPQALQEYAVRAYKKPLMENSAKSISADAGAYAPTTMNDHVTVDNGGVNTSFDIDIPYTIPSDGQQHLVAIKQYDLPATYHYYTVPKMDKDVFLQADITNWQDLSLLPGPTNIFYEGTYVGQGNIDMRTVTDTMSLSLGRDKKIVVKKDRNVKLRSVKTIGTNVRETFAYTISVRNARKESVTVVVQDQLPVSNDKDIEIEDRNTSNAVLEEATGMLKWNLTLAPNETRKIEFGYTVKYPKGKVVNNLQTH